MDATAFRTRMSCARAFINKMAAVQDIGVRRQRNPYSQWAKRAKNYLEQAKRQLDLLAESAAASDSETLERLTAEYDALLAKYASP